MLPPIPVAFLLATKIIEDIGQLTDFLGRNEMTITGGLNFARAPWNNPVLNALIDMYKRMKKGTVKYGLVHGKAELEKFKESQF